MTFRRRRFNQALALQDRIDSLALTGLLGKLAPSLRVKVKLALQRATENLASTLTGVLPSIVAAVSHLVVSLFVMFFVMYYLFLNIHYVYIRSAEFLPFKQENAIWLMRQFEHITRAILIGQILDSSLQGLMGGIGFAMFGMNDAVLWGIVMAVLSLVPIVGTSPGLAACLTLPPGAGSLLQGFRTVALGSHRSQSH